MLTDINFNLRWWKDCKELGHGPAVTRTPKSATLICIYCMQEIGEVPPMLGAYRGFQQGIWYHDIEHVNPYSRRVYPPDLDLSSITR